MTIRELSKLYYLTKLIERDELRLSELEARLQPSAVDKRIVLNSFIMSATKSADLRQWWNMTKLQLEEKHVMCLDYDDCVEVMMGKLMEWSKRLFDNNIFDADVATIKVFPVYREHNQIGSISV